MEYSTSHVTTYVDKRSREYEVHREMNEWAARGWRLVTASCRNLDVDPLTYTKIEYVFFWERSSQPSVS